MELRTGHTAENWWIIAPGGDVDEAWDNAKDVAMNTWGSGFVGIGLYAADFAQGDSPLLESAQMRHVDGTASPVALPIAKSSDWAKRKARVVVNDPSLRVNGEVGATLAVGDGLVDAAIVAALAETDKALAGGEHIVEVTLAGLKRRTKVDVTRFPSPSAKRFVVLGDRRVILAEAPSSSEARKLAKDLAVGGVATSVWTLGGREGDLPLLEARENVVAQRATFSTQIAKLKKAEVNRVAGWLFVAPWQLDTPAVLADNETDTGDVAFIEVAVDAE